MRWIAFGSSRFFTTGQADRQADKALEEKKETAPATREGARARKRAFWRTKRTTSNYFSSGGEAARGGGSLPCLACEDGGGRAQDLPWGWACLEKSVCRHVERMEGRRRRRTETRAVGPALAASHSSPHSIETWCIRQLQSQRESRLPCHVTARAMVRECRRNIRNKPILISSPATRDRRAIDGGSWSFLDDAGTVHIKYRGRSERHQVWGRLRTGGHQPWKLLVCLLR